MMKKLFHLYFCPLIVLAAMVVSAQGGEKITLCHIPQDDPTNPDTITVSVSSLSAHLAHNDTIGECDTTCKSDGVPCDTPSISSSECCNGICSGEGICASECTIGPEWSESGGTNCSFELPCCPEAEVPGTIGGIGGGICIGGSCFTQNEGIVECSFLGNECDNFYGPFCCFDYSCPDFDDDINTVGACEAP